MQIMLILVYGFAVLSALFWLYALVFNLSVTFARFTSEKLVRPSTVWIAGTLAGLMTYFASHPLWSGWGWPWLFLLAAPDIVAVLSDRVYYRNHKQPPAPDSDNPTS